MVYEKQSKNIQIFHKQFCISQIHEIMEVTHTIMVFSMCFSGMHKLRVARVPFGCKSSGGLFLCSSLLGILYLLGTFVSLCSALFRLSSPLPNSPSACIPNCVLRVHHLPCSCVPLLVQRFRSRYPPSSIALWPRVLSSAYPAFDRSLLGMSVLHTRMVCCNCYMNTV